MIPASSANGFGGAGRLLFILDVRLEDDDDEVLLLEGGCDGVGRSDSSESKVVWGSGFRGTGDGSDRGSWAGAE
jgi:hypothetical protein